MRASRIARQSAFPLGVFAVTQALIAFWVVTSSGRQKVMPMGQVIFFNHPKAADPGYWEIITNWDGQWYELIATQGYQVPAPGEPLATHKAWAWSFPPLYPMAVRTVTAVTRLPYAQTAWALSLVAGAVAVLIFYRLLRESGGLTTARVATILFCCFTSAPLMQFAYSESLGLLLLMGFFLALRRRNYGLALLAMVLLSFTRLITAPLLVVVAFHVIQGYRSSGMTWFRSRCDEVLLAALAVYAIVGSVVWLVIGSQFIGAAAGLSRTNSYLSLHLGWFTETLDYAGPLILLLLVVILLAMILYASSERAQGWGSDLRAWTAVYPLYLALVTIIQPGILRYLLMAPTLPMMFVGRLTPIRGWKLVQIVAVAALLLVSQYYFVSRLVVIDRYGRIFGP